MVTCGTLVVGRTDATIGTLTTVGSSTHAQGTDTEGTAENFKLTLKTGVEPVVATCCTRVCPRRACTEVSASTVGGCWKPTWRWAGAPAAH